MKLLFLLIFTIISGGSFAQITITGSDLPQAGTTFLLGNDTTLAVPLGTPSATWQAWDFSALNNHYYKVADYDSTANTPYAGDFPTSNVDTYGPSWMYSTLYGGAPVDQSSNGYMFWLSDNTGFWATGFRADEGPYSSTNVYENPNELLIGAPATYGSVFNNSSRWELSMDLVSGDLDTFYIVNREKTMTVDAWGEITTPYGTFSDVIRYHEYFTEQDSVRSEFMTWDSTFVFMADTGNIYTYMANGIGYPVAIVHADVNNNIESVEYLIDSLFVSLNSLEPSFDLKIYPNPNDGNLKLVLNENPLNGLLVVYNLIGKEVKLIKSINSKSNHLDFSDLPVGVYTYQFSDDKGINKTGRFIIK